MRDKKTSKAMKELMKRAGTIFTKIGQAKEFLERQPLFYDKSRIWWIWNEDNHCYEICDEVDILNSIQEFSAVDIINSGSRSEILNSLKQVGRKNTPKDLKKNWVQFRNSFVDVVTGKITPVTSKYFATNPIDWRIGESEETPNLDKIFEEWVGKDFVKTLYQIIAYCLYRDYPIHRVFYLFGEGLNGKSTFLAIIVKFLGESNVCATELDTLINSRFEVTRLNKKLACIMGETNLDQMSKTSLIKKLSGNDLIGFEYKNKDPFEDKNYAKLIIATNNLPPTEDKTIGWYRRMVVLDFLNQFTEKKDILLSIPENEFENLAKKSIRMLKELLADREFHKEGEIEERKKRYEDRSNPFDKFFEETISEEYDSHITNNQFRLKFNEWCREYKFRVISDFTLNKYMKDKGIDKSSRYIDIDEFNNGKLNKKRIKARTWEGIKWK